ncbi:hypothetical protein BsWGS_16946 [Bradybaena similaris]
MGGKNSVVKHDQEPPNTASPSRPHQYEEIDDVLLVKQQELGKPFSNSSAACHLGAESPLSPVKDVNLISELKLKSKSLPDVVVASAAEAAKPSTCSPNANARYHPYDEVSAEQLSTNHKGLNENKVKQKDGDKFVKKKNKKKENEDVYSEKSKAAIKPAALAQTDRYHPYDDVTDDLLVSNNAKKITKEDISKVKQNFKEKANKKNQKELSSVDESLSLEATSKPSISTGYIKGAPQGVAYEEIAYDQLSSKGENTVADKTNKGKDCSEKAGKKTWKGMLETGVKNDQAAPNTRPFFNTGPENAQTNVRNHPYDEITQEELDLNRKVNKDKGGKLKTQKTEKNANKMQAASDFSETEYLNVGALQTACVQPQVRESCSNEQCGEKDDLTDVYAVPQKKKPKEKQTQLNYIEVEFNSSAPKVEAKSQHSPTNYKNVVIKDGKLLLTEC